MPDLGKYAFEVGLAYGLSFVLLAGLVAFIWWRSARVHKALKRVEARREGTTDNG